MKVDFESFNAIFFHYEAWFKFQKCYWLLVMQKSFYPWFMLTFYMNLKVDGINIVSLVKGKKIVLGSQLLESILWIPNLNTLILPTKTWPKGYDCKTIFHSILRHPSSHLNVPLPTNMLDLEMNILHLIVIHIMRPKGGSHTKVIYTDALLMFKIIHCQGINLFDLMMWNMTYLLKRLSFHMECIL